MFENRKFGIYPQNTGFDDLTIEYKLRLFTRQPIDCLNGNKVEGMKVSLIGQSLDNRIYENNPRNTGFNDLPFDGYERFIARIILYCINDNIVFR